MMANLPSDEVHDILRRTSMPKHTENTIDDPDEFAHQLQVAAKKGYATDEGEQEIGVRCVAVTATAGMSGSADPATCTPVPTTTARDPGPGQGGDGPRRQAGRAGVTRSPARERCRHPRTRMLLGSSA
jgi:hypothetical protein